MISEKGTGDSCFPTLVSLKRPLWNIRLARVPSSFSRCFTCWSMKRRFGYGVKLERVLLCASSMWRVGCTVYEFKNWSNIFDQNTQTWEPWPDPEPKGKLLVESNENGFVYDPKERKWDFELDFAGTMLKKYAIEIFIHHCNR